jgi:hypothetical protein
VARHTTTSPIPSALTVTGETLYRREIERIRSIVLAGVAPSDPELEEIYRTALEVFALETTFRSSNPTRHHALEAAESIIREALAPVTA